MSDGKVIILFLIVFCILINVTRLKTVTLLKGHIALNVNVCFSLHDACQRLSGHICPLNNFMIQHHLKQKYELSWFWSKYIYWNITILYFFHKKI